MMLSHHRALDKLKLFHLEDGGFYHQRDYKSLSSFISTLSQKEISEKYSYYYIILYVELQGIKGKISYDKLAILWRVEKNSIKNILIILDKKGLILRTREQGNRTPGRYFYLFIIPLVHPDFEDVTFS